MLRLQWKANNPIDNENGSLYYRIDFNTPIINMCSRFRLFHANYLPPPGSVGASSEVPQDRWYDISIPGNHPTDDFVRDNVRLLRNFMINHAGTSNEYIQALNIINLYLRGVAGVLDSGNKKNKKRQSIRRKTKTKLKRRSKSIKRRSKSIKRRSKSIKRKTRRKY